MVDYLKIDLHCHTKKTKKGDGAGRNVTPQLFKEKIELVDVKIVAITNHNHFDYQQYKELRTCVEGMCQVWPGVEIDVIGQSKYHLIVVVKPDDAEIFDNSCKMLFSNTTPDTCQLTLEDVYAAFNSYDAIYVPHFHDKKPAISDFDKQKLVELVGDDARVFIEPRNHRTLGVLANKEMSVLIGSDVKDWNKYEDCTFADLRLPVASFAEFLLLSRRDKGVVDSLLSKKKALKVTGIPHPSVKLPLQIYPDINIIFGQKGTGKTEILKSLYEEMICSGRNCKKYIASERGEDFSALLDIRDMELSLEKMNIDSCETEFEEIYKWKDDNPIPFSKYLDWYRTMGNSNSKIRMKITNAVHDFYSKSDTFDEHRKDKVQISQIQDRIHKIKLERYISNDDAQLLITLVEKLGDSILKARKNDLIGEYSSQLTNKSIDIIKSLADKSSDTISRPSTSGFKEFALKRITLLKNINLILTGLKSPEYNERVRLGSLEGKGDIYVNHRYRMLCDDERKPNYPGYRITSLRSIVSTLEYIKQHIFDVDISIHIEQLNNLCEENRVTSVKPFIGRSKQIVTSDGAEYNPSNGEKGILLLEQVLHGDADAYFLDEPELGMGNSYINTDIRPLICDLAKQRKYVVIATHNANIAVRTLPYMSIYRTHENGIYKTYMGNPFDDQLICIDDKSNIKSWTEESMHSLEGGKEAFYERRDIYESKDN